MNGEWKDGAKPPKRCTFWYWSDGAAMRQCAYGPDHDGNHACNVSDLVPDTDSLRYRRAVDA